MSIRVTIWNEYRHERKVEEIRKIYPQGLHTAIGNSLKKQADLQVRYATLDEPEHGLTEAVLAETDVLIWWGHCAHGEVADAIVDRVQKRVLDGMGLVVLHSGHKSKIFMRMTGCSGNLRWRAANELSRVWVVNPNHPITEGLPPYFELPEEMYGEAFDIPEPDELVFLSWFEGGDVFRSGCCWHRGKGKMFYFQPGHETHPSFHHPQVLKVIENAVRWARFSGNTAIDSTTCHHAKIPLNPIAPRP